MGRSDFMSNEILSDKDFWDNEWKDVTKYNRIDFDSKSIRQYLRNYPERQVFNYLKPFLKNIEGSVFEFGCGNSRWLPFFAKYYGLRASGVDYSKKGCELAEIRLKDEGITDYKIHEGDFFKFKTKEGFNIVMSFGVVEHFSDMSQLIKLFSKILCDDGLMITMIPKFSGFWGKIYKAVAYDIYKIHNCATMDDLIKAHDSLDVLCAVDILPFYTNPLIHNYNGRLKRIFHNRTVHFVCVVVDVLFILGDIVLQKIGININFFKTSHLVIARKHD
jgi:SAM-dependent methyltransferase